MLGLFVTFGGLYGYTLQVPPEPAKLANLLPWLAVGFLTVWIGGILAGNALVPTPPGIRPALVAQPVVAGVATVAGVLSGIVVILRIGPSLSPVPGTPAEWIVAVLAAAFVWIGGFLMGRSMRRFVRRNRSAA